MTKDLSHIDVITKMIQSKQVEMSILDVQIKALKRSRELMNES